MESSSRRLVRIQVTPLFPIVCTYVVYVRTHVDFSLHPGTTVAFFKGYRLQDDGWMTRRTETKQRLKRFRQCLMFCLESGLAI